MDEAKPRDLPEDIVFDVLTRVPTKALSRFRCVSKAWRLLISDPIFVATQRSCAGPHLVGVYFGACKAPPEVRVIDMDGNVVTELEVQLLGKDGRGVLQKDTTMRPDHIFVLGHLQQGTRRAGAMFIDLAAGRACAICTGTPLSALDSIGRAALSGVFKVICLEKTLPSWICNVATILVDGTEPVPLTCRQRLPPPFAFSWHPGRRATINGIVYFMACFNSYLGASNSGQGLIAAFDLESEEWKVINGPAFVIEEKMWYASLMELKGCMGVVQFLGHLPVRSEPYDEDCYAIIWLLVDPNKSVWVKDCTIPMPNTWVWTKQLWALDDGRILLLVREFVRKVVSKEDGICYVHKEFLVFYNRSTKTFTKFKEIPVGFYDKLVLYTGSLLS